MKHISTSVLPCRKSSNGEFADLRHVEVKARGRFARISINGQYRLGRSYKERYRDANPGWSFGTEWVWIDWTHFRRHCWHASINIGRRGITLSYGRSFGAA